MQGYSTPSRKRILEYLEENKSRTVTVADIENYLAKKRMCSKQDHDIQVFGKTDIRKESCKICCTERKTGNISIY